MVERTNQQSQEKARSRLNDQKDKLLVYMFFQRMGLPMRGTKAMCRQVIDQISIKTPEEREQIQEAFAGALTQANSTWGNRVAKEREREEQQQNLKHRQNSAKSVISVCDVMPGSSIFFSGPKQQPVGTLAEAILHKVRAAQVCNDLSVESFSMKNRPSPEISPRWKNCLSLLHYFSNHREPEPAGCKEHEELHAPQPALAPAYFLVAAQPEVEMEPAKERPRESSVVVLLKAIALEEEPAQREIEEEEKADNQVARDEPAPQDNSAEIMVAKIAEEEPCDCTSEYSELSYNEDDLQEGERYATSIKELNKLIDVGGTRQMLSKRQL